MPPILVWIFRWGVFYLGGGGNRLEAIRGRLELYRVNWDPIGCPASQLVSLRGLYCDILIKSI